jgi:hypothetical protein
VTDHVVGEEADGAALEAGEAGHGNGLEAPQEPPERVEGVAVGQALRAAVAVAEGDPTVLAGQDQPRLRAEEGVARPRLAALDGLQEERIGAGAQAQVGRQRRIEVGGQLGEDGDEIAPPRELAELVTGPRERRDC